MDKRDIIIIGAGPAGSAAALQLRRNGLDPLILERGKPGGLLWQAGRIENHPGFPDGISGQALAGRINRGLQRWTVRIVQTAVSAVRLDDSRFFVSTDRGDFHSRFLILASGTRPRQLDDPIVAIEAVRSVFYDVTHLRRMAGMHIVIIGAGDAAFDYALTLSRHNSVTIVSRSPEPCCLALLQEAAWACRTISFLPQAQVLKITKNGSRSVRVLIDTAGATRHLDADAVLAAIGRVPCLDFLHSSLRAELPTRQQQGRLHLAGDVCNGDWRQAAIAAGDGMLAAVKIVERLHKEKHENSRSIRN